MPYEYDDYDNEQNRYVDEHDVDVDGQDQDSAAYDYSVDSDTEVEAERRERYRPSPNDASLQPDGPYAQACPFLQTDYGRHEFLTGARLRYLSHEVEEGDLEVFFSVANSPVGTIMRYHLQHEEDFDEWVCASVLGDSRRQRARDLCPQCDNWVMSTAHVVYCSAGRLWTYIDVNGNMCDIPHERNYDWPMGHARCD